MRKDEDRIVRYVRKSRSIKEAMELWSAASWGIWFGIIIMGLVTGGELDETDTPTIIFSAVVLVVCYFWRKKTLHRESDILWQDMTEDERKEVFRRSKAEV